MVHGRASRSRMSDMLIRTGGRHPGLTLLCWAVVCFATIPGVLRLHVDTSTDSVLDRVDSAWQTYQQSQDLFGGDELLVVAFTGSIPFDPDVLAKVEQLSALASELDGVRRVDSLATVPVIRVDAAGELDLRASLVDAPSDPVARSLHVRARLRGDRIAPRSLVSEDGRTFAVNLVLYRGIEADHAQLLTELHAIVDPMGGAISGVPVFRVAVNESTRAEILAFAPLTAGLIAAFLWVTFRDPWVVLIGLAPGVIGSYLMVGAMGYLGAPLSITTMILPSIVLAVGCTYAMHLLAAASGGARAGAAIISSEVLEDALGHVALPVALSGLTTVVGFVSMTVVHIEAVRNTGGYGALGVFIVTLVSLTLLPAALAWLPRPAPSPHGFPWVRTRIAPRLVAHITKRSGVIIIAWTVATLLVGLGALRVEVETDATRWLPPGNPVRDSYESIRASLSGISPMNVVVRVPEGQSVLDPAVLESIDGLSTHLATLDEVGKTLSIADPLRQIHGEMRGDPTQPLPNDSAMTAQYMLLLESVESIEDLITADRRAANLMIRADDNGSAGLVHIASEVDAWWTLNGPPSTEAITTGIMYEFARAEDEIAYGQLRGLAVALAVISGVLFAIFRWPRLAFVALVPNALPLVLLFGCVGLFDVPLDAGTVLIGTLVVGIAVDDTIHITTGFYERMAGGATARIALEQTFVDVLPAVVGTTVMISMAFFVLGFSEFSITRNLGLLTGGILLLCLMADITLLPALLLRMPTR